MAYTTIHDGSGNTHAYYDGEPVPTGGRDWALPRGHARRAVHPTPDWLDNDHYLAIRRLYEGRSQMQNLYHGAFVDLPDMMPFLDELPEFWNDSTDIEDAVWQTKYHVGRLAFLTGTVLPLAV